MLRYALVLFVPSIAWAQSAQTKAEADALFDDGKKLVATGDFEHGCAKFEASLKVLDQLGTRLNLGDCYDKAGRTASAWAEFRETADQAEKRGDARASYARSRADALAPKLTRMTISVKSRVPGLVVKRDGTDVSPDLFDTALPVDPGSYLVEASASGYQPWSSRVDATRPGATTTVDVPALTPVPVAQQPAQQPKTEPPKVARHDDEGDEGETTAPPSDARHKRHVIAYAVGGGGIVALGAGVVLGFAAKSKWDSAGSHCNASHVCDPTGVSINHDARTLGNVGTVVGSVGLAAIAAGVVLYLTAPSDHAPVEREGLRVTPSTTGVAISWAARW